MEIPAIEKCFFFGKILRTHGYKGGLKVTLDVDEPESYRELEMVFIELKKKLVPYFIENIHFERNKANLKLEDINTIEEAERFINGNIYLPLELLPKLREKKFYFHEIPGFKVVDAVHGELGPVNRVIELPNNPLLAIDHKGKEILLPIADDLIVKLDRKTRTLHVKAPEGLIELYM
jgi:16S rRNA processing protein RimM